MLFEIPDDSFIRQVRRKLLGPRAEEIERRVGHEAKFVKAFKPQGSVIKLPRPIWFNLASPVTAIERCVTVVLKREAKIHHMDTQAMAARKLCGIPPQNIAVTRSMNLPGIDEADVAILSVVTCKLSIDPHQLIAQLCWQKYQADILVSWTVREFFH